MPYVRWKDWGVTMLVVPKAYASWLEQASANVANGGVMPRPFSVAISQPELCHFYTTSST